MRQRACEREWTAEKAEGVRKLIERLTGKPCPCDRGEPCPALPDIGARVQLGLPKVRRLLALPGLLAALDVVQQVMAAGPSGVAA